MHLCPAHARMLALACGAVLLAAAVFAAEPPEQEAAYVKKFMENFPKVDPPPALETYASPEHFDALFMGANLDKNLKDVQNDNAFIAWSLSYYMRALNDMHRATGETKYLEANLRFVRAVAAV